MTAPNRNLYWSTTLAHELAAQGLRHVAISPGSRSAPLALAFHDANLFDATVHIDERSGAYFALGAARATGLPAAVVSTSGTAAANYLPAVVEADRAGVPLIVLTADRPYELRDTGSNQTIDQLKLYGDRVRWFHELGLPEATLNASRHLRQTAARAWAHALGPPAGPVHLNLPFREPLGPTHVPGDVEAAGAAPPSIRVHAPVWTPGPDAIRHAADACLTGNGVILAGPRTRHDAFAGLVLQLAERLDCRILADPLSGLRSHDDDRILAHYDAWLKHAALRQAARPDWILQFGAAMTSKAVRTWLDDHPDATRVVFDETGRHHDELATATSIVASDAEAAVQALLERLVQPADPEAQWNDLLSAADASAAALNAAQKLWEGTLPALAVQGLGSDDHVFVGSSLPVRDLDRYGGRWPGGPRILSSRGASGIDGVVSAGAGAAHATAARTRILVGDVTLAHDVGGLRAVAKHAAQATLIVVNNGGGAIFDGLPIARQDVPFDDLFLTPPGLDVAHAAKAFGLNHDVCDPAGAAQALGRLDAGVLEVRVDRTESARIRTKLDADLAKRLDGLVARSAA